MIREITINPVLNGFIVRVGCQSLAYTSVEKLIGDLNSYLRDPVTTEKRIIETEGFNKAHVMNQPCTLGDRDTAASVAMQIAGQAANQWPAATAIR